MQLSRSEYPGALAVPWGDGSGTGTGDSMVFYTPSLDGTVHTFSKELWMGAWSNARICSTTSNWKELYTLLHTLKREQTGARLRGWLVLYSTDNTATYWIAHNRSSSAPSLHELICTISQLEAQLGCMIEVIHVPGQAMIVHGEDGQSRSLWSDVNTP